MSTKDLNKLTITQLKSKLKRDGISVPKVGTGSNGTIIKKDLIKANNNKIITKNNDTSSSTSEDSLRDILPEEIITEISLNANNLDIANLCRTDKKMAKMCNSLVFWQNYFHGDNNIFFDLIKQLFKTKEYNLFLFLWENTDNIGIKKDIEMYQYALQYTKNDELKLKIWKFVPMSNRSYFHEEVVDKLNKNLKRWGIAPSVGHDADDWFFVKHDDNFDYTRYSDLTKPIKEWETLKDMVLFTGSFYQLSTVANYEVATGTLNDQVDFKLPTIDSEIRDTISRIYKWNIDIKVVDIFKNIAYIGYDAISDVSSKAGMVQNIKIDKDAKYPTLLIEFEES